VRYDSAELSAHGTRNDGLNIRDHGAEPSRRSSRAVAAAQRLTWAGVLFINAACASLNPTPEVPNVTSAQVQSRPVVVKVHATWCLYCMTSQGAWSEVYDEYKERAHFVVFDVSDDEAEAASQRRARELGLGAFFEAYSGDTGTVAVLDARNGEIIERMAHGGDADEYRRAIRTALSRRQAAR
jgi:thiol-disulfide isomerase/thioredoxin